MLVMCIDGMFPPSLGRVASLDVPKTPPHMAMIATRLPPPTSLSSLTLNTSASGDHIHGSGNSPSPTYGASLTPSARMRPLEGNQQTLKPNTGSLRTRTLTRQSGKPSTIVSALGARSTGTPTNDEKDNGSNESKEDTRSGTITAAEMMDHLRRVETRFSHPLTASGSSSGDNLGDSSTTGDDSARALTIDVTAPERHHTISGGNNASNLNIGGLQLGSLSPLPSPRTTEMNLLRKRLIYQVCIFYSHPSSIFICLTECMYVLHANSM
jgi:hypothetical protein